MGKIIKSGIEYAGGGGGGQAYTAADGVKIENGVIKLDPATALTALGYTEIELSKTDANNNTVTVHVLGRTS